MSSGLATSSSTLPASCSAPASSSASSDAAPAVALMTSSPKPAASANVPSLAGPPISLGPRDGRLVARRRASPAAPRGRCAAARCASVLPTMPVPRTADAHRANATRARSARPARRPSGACGGLRPRALAASSSAAAAACGGLALVGLGRDRLLRRLRGRLLLAAAAAQVRAVGRVEECSFAPSNHSFAVLALARSRTPGSAARRRSPAPAPGVSADARVARELGELVGAHLAALEARSRRRSPSPSTRRPRSARRTRRRRRGPAGAKRGVLEVLGADADDDVAGVATTPSGAATSANGSLSLPPLIVAGEEVHRRRADEARDEDVDRVVVELARRCRPAAARPSA